MNIRRFAVCAAILLIPAASIPAKNDISRFVLAVGANDGGPQRQHLRYAVSDAQSFARVLNRIGGVSNERTTVLIDPRAQSLRDELLNLSKKLAEEKKSSRAELIFYYSGHSDEEGLLLGNESFSYKELRTAIEKLPADVRIAVLDSCSSGAFTRIKGGKKVSPFITDNAQNMRGYAFMTSSSADEVSQESDRIGGSFFTHYLIGGLRGAADTGQDGRISLNEAYQYAYRETLTRTERTEGGAQHPNYNIQMTGTGDVILTDLRAGESQLTIGKNISGKVYIHSGSALAAEISKQKGSTITLSLEEGTYTALTDNDGTLADTKFTLVAGNTFFLNEGYFHPVIKENTEQRGSSASEKIKRRAYALIPFAANIIPSADGDKNIVSHVRLFLFGSRCSQLDGLMAGVGIGIVDEDMTGVQLAGIGNITLRDGSWLEAAAAFNYNGRSFKGVQAAGVINANMENMSGVQIASAANYNQGSFSGVQCSGVACINMGSFRGVQSSSALSLTGEDFSGMQLSGGLNLTLNRFSGFQAAPFNAASEFRGFQLGVINGAMELHGLQLGLINLAGKTDGVQFGLINISKENDGYPVGLISIVKNGETRAAVFADESGFLRTSISHGTKNIYNILVFGGRADGKAGSAGIGIGIKKDIGKRWISLDCTTSNIYIQGMNYSEDTFTHSQIRLTGGYFITEKISLFAGADYNHLYRSRTDIDPIKPFAGRCRLSDKNAAWPGIFIGVQI
ncbi:MAG: caspase family protein [Spirochaetota bacterium]